MIEWDREVTNLTFQLKNAVSRIDTMYAPPQLSGEMDAEVFELREKLDISNRELNAADKTIAELRRELENLGDENHSLRRKISALTPPTIKPSVRYPGLRHIRWSENALGPDEIFQRVWAEAASLESESKETLSRAVALFDTEITEEFVTVLGRNSGRPGQHPRPGLWSASALLKETA